jgi:DNA-binding SARP family transcriptional activator
MNIALKLFGVFEVSVEGEALPSSAWRLTHPRQLLQILAVQPGLQVSRGQLLDYLWPKLEQSAANNRLYHTIHTIRRTFSSPFQTQQEPVVLLQSDVVMLNPAHVITTDVSQYLALISQARHQSNAPDLSALMEQAVKLYKGDLLINNPYEDWLVQPREACKHSFIWALDNLAAYKRNENQTHQAIALYQKLVEIEPANELAHRALMELHDMTGHPERSIYQYSVCKRFLHSDLDVEPTPETIGLLRRISDRLTLSTSGLSRLPNA